MKKILEKHKSYEKRTLLGVFIFVSLMFFSIYFSPNFVADNLSSDGILEKTTIFHINSFRLGLSIFSTIGLIFSSLYIIKPKFLYLIQLKFSKIPVIKELFVSTGSVIETRETHMKSRDGGNVRNFEINIIELKRLITGSLIVIVFLLHIASALAVWMNLHLGNFFLKKIYVKIFWVSNEGAIPTWYSACALLFCSLLLLVICFLKRKRRDPYFWNWVGLSTIFALMSLDEATSIHEMMGGFLSKSFNPIGVFHSAWVILGIPFVLIFGIYYLKFTLNLQKKTKYLFIVAFITYLGGALGLEMVGSAILYEYRSKTMTYQIIATIEEILEMSGIVVFIYALIDYIEAFLRSKEIRLFFK
jgi:hypothetical protein